MKNKVEKVIIIGGGPAGLSAAIYAARDGLEPLVFAGLLPGGQPMLTSVVENYPGHEKILGPDLVGIMREQAISFGARFINKNIVRVDFTKRPFKILDSGENFVESQSIIIATGAKALWLGLPSEQRLIGKGVSACANCDGFFFRDKTVAVVGGGDTALEEVLSLTKYAKKVYVIHRRDHFRASKAMQDKVFSNKKIEVIWNAEVAEVLGENKVEGIKLTSTGGKNLTSSYILKLDGLFIAIGHKPDTDLFKGQINMDEKGYILTKNYMTSIEGVFAGGDCIDPKYKQLATAIGTGVAAAIEADKWLE
jgi:thioredoxin reductase (NADPH)